MEAFGVHAWNLVEFLSKKVRKNDRNASDYIPSFEPPDGKPIEQALLRLQKQFFALQRFKKLILEANSMSPMPANSMHGLFQQSSNFRGRSALRIAQN